LPPFRSSRESENGSATGVAIPKLVTKGRSTNRKQDEDFILKKDEIAER
jgi:hypothetical protein